MNSMKIVSWNTNGLRATVKQGFFDDLFTKVKGDVICLQETKVEREQLPEEVLNIPGYESYFESSKGRKGYSGVAIYTNVKPEKISCGVGVKQLDQEGRLIIAEYKDFYLLNCYFPNGGGAPERLEYKLEYYDAMLVLMKKLEKKKPVIVCGDVNVAHNEIDIARPKENENHVGFLRVERDWMDAVLDAGFVDVFRRLHPDTRDAYTWWDQKSRARDRNIGWRIDYFLVSPALMKKVKKIEHLTEYYGSDHCPVVLDIDIK